MPSYLMRFVGAANGYAHAIDGTYLQSYDPEAHWPDGSYDGGRLEVTADPAKARVFPDVESALACWKSGPTCACHRLRVDGYPNRPLTAFSAVFISSATAGIADPDAIIWSRP
jgi:hypothetical protein